jgi:S-adenosylmethionine hydrolase
MRCVSLPIPPGASATFHGRDVFAPAAAVLAQGIALDALGEPLADPVIRRTPEAVRRDDGAVVGLVIAIDRFGNAVTNLMARRGGVVMVGARRLALSRAYGDVGRGTPMALVGSSGLVEIALREGSAASALGLVRGSEVVLLPAG